MYKGEVKGNIYKIYMRIKGHCAKAYVFNLCVNVEIMQICRLLVYYVQFTAYEHATNVHKN